jgi:hypothetical protein
LQVIPFYQQKQNIFTESFGEFMIHLLLYTFLFKPVAAAEKTRDLFNLCMEASSEMTVEAKRNAQQARCIKDFKKVISFEDCIEATKSMTIESSRNSEQERCIVYYKRFINFEQCFDAAAIMTMEDKRNSQQEKCIKKHLIPEEKENKKENKKKNKENKKKNKENKKKNKENKKRE